MARDDVDAPALVLFTSGSTGQPTGVVLTHRNLGNARQIAAALDLQPSDRGMLVLPLSYSYGRSVVHSHLLCGASVHLDPRFLYPRLVVDAMAREQITTFAGVPLTYELLRRHIEPARLALPALRQVTQAGGAMKSETRAWVRQAFPQAAFFSMYGATEATARLTIVPAEKSVEKDGSIGIPIPGVHVRVVDDDGADVPRGATGHLVAAGDNISPGYLDDPERTAETFRGGWLWTGDLAREDDDGYLYVVGRAKEMMKIGGRRASPRTVEDVVIAHPDVADAVVCGVRDEMNGEVVAVALVEKEGRHVEHEALRRFCRQRLPAWLVPRFVQVLARLPRNENGKVQRANVAAGLQRVADDERQDEAGLRHHTTSSSTHVAPSGSFAGSGGRTMNLGTGPSGTARQPSSLSLAHAESPARITDTTKSSSRPTSGDRT
jgi:acyl-coenzyme A synthetase/AMP-(fatty) acid ligase